MKTAAKQEEDILRELGVNYRSILDTIDEGVGVFDRGGNALWINRHLAERNGLIGRECAGTNIREVFPAERYGDLCDRRKMLHDRVFESGAAVVSEDTRDGRLYKNRYYPVYKNGRVTAVILCSADVTDTRKAEEEARTELLEQRNVILRSINGIYEKALLCDTVMELGAACLALIETMTGSAFSFVGEIGADGLMHDLAVSNPGWDCYTTDTAGLKQPPRNLKIHGLYGSVVKSGKSLLTNDPARHPDSVGTPEGHPAIVSFLGVPYIREGKVTGILATANREGGFTEEDREKLEAITPTVFEVLIRKRTEETVRENEHLMRTIMDSAADFLFIKDRESRIVMVNRAYGRVFGVDIGGIIGKNDYELYPDPEMAAGVIENDRYVMETGRTLTCEESAMTPDGLRTYLLTKVPWRDTNGRVMGIMGIAHDITGLKNAETAMHGMIDSLKRSKDYINILYETTGTILSSQTPRKDIDELCKKVMKFLDCHAFFNYLLEGGETVLRLNACDGVTDRQKKELEILPLGAAVCGCAVRDGRRIVVENIQTTEDERTADIRQMGIRAYVCNPLMADGRAIGSIAFGTRSRDRFTDEELLLIKTVADSVSMAIKRKLNEEMLIRQAEELKIADRNKNEFLGTLSHELRNPLATISMGLALLDISEDRERQDRAKTIMKRQMDQLCRMVDDLMDATRITRNKIVLKKEDFELNRAALSAAEDLKAMFDEKGIAFETDIGAEPAFVNADPVRIRQLIGNLLHNALKFTKSGDRVVLSVSAGPGGAVIGVRDDGIGIDPKFMPSLFEPFMQADKSMDRKNGGLGLGLSIVKGIAELHGGSVSARSDGLGKGALFTVEIPMKQGERL